MIVRYPISGERKARDYLGIDLAVYALMDCVINMFILMSNVTVILRNFWTKCKTNIMNVRGTPFIIHDVIGYTYGHNIIYPS
jgi:hypothetical protein